MMQLFITGFVSAWLCVGVLVLSYTKRVDERDMGTLDAVLILIAWPAVVLKGLR